MSRRPAVTLALAALVFNGVVTATRVLGAGEPLSLTFECCALALLGLLLGRHVKTRRLVAALVGGWLVLLGYHCATEALYLRTPSLYDDWRLARNGFDYLRSPGSSLGVKIAVFILAPAWLALTVGAANTLMARAAELQGRARSAWLVGWSVGLGLCVLGAVAELPRVARLASVPSLQLWHNAQRSLRQYRLMRDWEAAPADRRYEALMTQKLQRRPNVFFLMIEAYGEVLGRAPFEAFTTTLAAQVEERLRRKGYETRSSYSRAPVHGGGSWFSIATMHTGMRIDAASSYARFEDVSRTVPSLTRFFAGNGYRTVSLMPANRLRAGHDEDPDQFARDVVFEGPDLHGYRGPAPSWGAAPDQYSLQFLREHLRKEPGPVFVNFMSCSTHWNWSRLPTFVEPQPRDEWVTVPNTIEHPYSHAYAAAIEYEWRVLLEFIEAEPTDDAVFIIVGDHQPWLGRGQPRDSYLTPVHVVTRHLPTLEAFETAAFRPHLFPQVGEALAHEGLLSLVISRLAMADGQARAADYAPAGLPLSGLKAVAH